MNEKITAIALAADITAAWLANPNSRIDADAVPAFLTTIHAAVVALDTAPFHAEPASTAITTYVPAVSPRKSLASADHIISMIDGKPYRTLRRHLSRHGLTPDEYRTRYNLKPDYPMVAPAYSEARRAMAKKIGLGRKPNDVSSSVSVPPVRRKLGIALPA